MSYQRIEIAPEQVDRQREICQKIRALHQTPPLALVDTYGCQQNEADSQRLRGFLREAGYAFTENEAEADLIVVNTCAVREHAEMRVLGNVGQLNHTKKAKPEQKIVLCGCMVQQPHMAEKLRKSYSLVDLVFGPHELWRFPELLYRILTESGHVFATAPSEGNIAEGVPVQRENGVKAWLSIMYGCNNFCTYCVVPHVRGRERSRRPEEIEAECRELVAAGYKDITLLGQNVNSYGKDLGLGTDFADLLARLCQIEGDFLLRFMTSHPKDATEKLFRTMAENPKCARHFHLPVQAGSDRVLHAMNRVYDRQSYLDKVALARKYMPDIVLTTDIIVGFPGETAEEFAETLSLVKQVEYDAMFTFIYSPRMGTPAAKLPDPVSRAEKQVWFDQLLAVQNPISAAKHAAYVGKRLRVLVDGESGDARWPLSARTSGGRLVRVAGDAKHIGQFISVDITGSNTWALYGEAVEEK